jgi:uracil-DNA glycosylase
MPEEFDFSELRKYLQGQMDMGEEDLLLDEPWTLTRKKSAVPAAGAPRPANPMPQMRPANPAPFPQPSQTTAPKNPAPFPSAAQSAFQAPAQPAFQQSAFQQSAFGTPAQPAPSPRPAPAPKLDAGLTIAPRAVKKTTAAYELADSIGAFYDALKTDALYARATNVVRYEGPEHPRLLILLAAPKPGESTDKFFQSPTGEMLVRLFGSLGYAPETLGVTYFYKDAPRALSPILLASLRRMLTKELSFIAPEIMITFSEPLFYDVFSKGKNFNELAGTALDFNGTKTVSLVDAYAMTTDKQLKWLTWKVHIPRSGLFTAAK